MKIVARIGLTLVALAGHAQAQPAGGFVGVLDPDARPPRLPRDAAATSFDAWLRRARAAGSTPSKLAFLDRGLSRSPYRAEVDRIPERLARAADGLALTSLGVAPVDRGGVARPFPLFPPRGRRPDQVHDALGFLPAPIQQACVAVGSVTEGTMRARWLGRRPFAPDQCWSATKHLQALHVVGRLGAVAPGVDLADTWLRGQGGGTARVRVTDLLRDIVSYDAGVPRSNGGAATLGELFARSAREAWNEAHTANDHDFRGNYGQPPLFARPELTDDAGRVLLTAPASSGPAGPNLVSTYDLTRLTAMAAWHLHLRQEARLTGAQWRALDDVLLAMGHDCARYVDVAIEALGAGARAREVAIASKVGFGVRSATGLTEIVYAAAVTLVDPATAPPRQRHMVFTLRGTHADPVVLDARMAEAVTELVRRWLDEDLF
ncbi:MAG: hypothetical protein KIT58_02585 [Planctomycetota bacterium]|nr:hypothetical protein [Planctomycetota bacterium]